MKSVGGSIQIIVGQYHRILTKKEKLMNRWPTALWKENKEFKMKCSQIHK